MGKGLEKLLSHAVKAAKLLGATTKEDLRYRDNLPLEERIDLAITDVFQMYFRTFKILPKKSDVELKARIVKQTFDAMLKDKSYSLAAAAELLTVTLSESVNELHQSVADKRRVAKVDEDAGLTVFLQQIPVLVEKVLGVKNI